MATTTTLQVQFRTVDGVRIRYADSGGSQVPVLLLTSPWPESVYAFAHMWTTLAEHARLFAVDLPGFGASERRDDLLSPRAMGGFLTRLIAEARRRLVRGRGTSGADGKCDRGHRWSCGSNPAR